MTKECSDWMPEINEVKHRIELLVGRDGWEETIGGDTLDYTLSAIFNKVVTEAYQECARAAELRAEGYAPNVGRILTDFARYLRTW